MTPRENIGHKRAGFESDRKLMAVPIVIGSGKKRSVRWHKCRRRKIKVAGTICAVILDILDGFRSRTDRVPMNSIVSSNHQADVDVGGHKNVG